jgi:4-hydroxy-2-oxovalerate aldolase
MREAPVILDCTIRDGSYAIDFKFTAQDTALVAEQLDLAGIRWIEIGHGLGLGASAAGKGRAASRDTETIAATRARVEQARIGAFFIPGIGTEADLREAAAAGLDFVRIGQNADEIEDAFPFVELARELDLEPFVNLMKTYGIPPSEFARAAQGADGVGAAGIYVVDSAGGMLPAEVAEYVRAARAAAPVPVGFHGHSNLHLAVANSISALEAGARFVDTSVYGIGRSSGNVPTEVMAAVLERLGLDSGVDALDIIDIAETYLKPLAVHLQPHDMVAVALGFGRFHSSFLPKALAAADEAGVNPFRLIVELGRRNPMELPANLLEETVRDLAGAPAPSVQDELARFSDPRFGPRRIGNRPEAMTDLLDGLEVVAAKRHLRSVIDVVHAPPLDEEAVTAEFVMEDDSMALGRVRYGSPEALQEVLDAHGGRLGLVLVDLSAGDPAAVERARVAVLQALPGRAILYRSAEMELRYLGDVAFAALSEAEPPALVLVRDPGVYAKSDVDALVARLGVVVEVARTSTGEPAPPAALVVVAGPLPASDGAGEEGSRTIALGAALERPSPRTVVLRRSDSYRNRLPALLAAADVVHGTPRGEPVG